jgi:hypothetical protein
VITTLVTNKDALQNTALDIARPVLCNKLECATDTRRLSTWLCTHLPGEGGFKKKKTQFWSRNFVFQKRNLKFFIKKLPF